MIETLYGSFNNLHPAITDLLQSNAMQRIRQVQQYGVSYRVRPLASYTRYDHCVGVWALLHRYETSLHEQIAGLLHDASHTAFSHIGDYIFKNTSLSHSYQDNIHEWYLQQTDVPTILMQHNIKLSEVLHKNGHFQALEQDLPNVCADRLEYNLQGAIIANLLTKQDIDEILADLSFDNKNWYFRSITSAQRLADISIHLTEYEWGSPGNHVLCSLFAQALQHALKIKLISSQDLHFSTDDVIWEKLETSKNTTLGALMTQVKNHEDTYSISPAQEGNYNIRGKFRGIDPFVMREQGLKRLTEIDTRYQKRFLSSKARVSGGRPVILSDQARKACQVYSMNAV